MAVSVRLIAAVGIAMTSLSCAAPQASTAGPPAPASTARTAALRAQVVATLPHDPTAFTQGLELADGVLYEGTGLYGRSEFRATNPQTGAVLTKVSLPESMFGEGITIVGAKVWQLTWRDGVAFHRDLATGTETGQARYSGEGWGLCHDVAGKRLVMSDGSARLTFRDPDTFEPTGEVTVTMAGTPVTELNELECVGNNTAYANVWQTNTIMRIDLATGQVTARVDLSGLLDQVELPGDGRNDAVPNGIAAIPGTDEFLVTGKLWPKVFRVKFAEAG
jgi:glutamine cyclotransferase